MSNEAGKNIQIQGIFFAVPVKLSVTGNDFIQVNFELK
jgi:hypothetical protein